MTYTEVRTAVEVLREFRDQIRNGDFEGWGLDPVYVSTVKTWLENLSDASYGERLTDD